MRTPVQSEIGLSDAEIVRYSRSPSELSVIVEMWNSTLVTFTFFDVIGILDLGIGDISDLCQESETTSLMSKAVERMYESPPDVLPYHVYQFLDLDYNIAMEIVAASATISKT
jgi:hypothetical protein